MRKLVMFLSVISVFSCGPSNHQFTGPTNYEIFETDLDQRKIDAYIRSAIGDFSSIHDLDESIFEKYTVYIDYHEKDPWLCKEYDTGTCIRPGSNNTFYIEVNTTYTPYSATYHEYLHFLLYAHGMNDSEHHEWMRTHGICQNRQSIVDTHCADTPIKIF